MHKHRHAPTGAIDFARSQRRPLTDAEGLLWHYLRRRQLGGHKFRRQHPVGPFVADFACLAGRVVIELDGGQHTDQLAYDRARDEYFRERGFHVLRFWNDDVMRRMDAVLDAIAVALDG